jgi:hypothetical protein
MEVRLGRAVVRLPEYHAFDRLLGSGFGRRSRGSSSC